MNLAFTLLISSIQIPAYFLVGINQDVVTRLGLAALAGTLLGIEREKHGRAAGLRTTLMVSMAACIAMIISDNFYLKSFAGASMPGGWHPDPARLAAGILSGMGFLGAGVIVRQSSHLISGVTTAATLWFVTIIGLAFGAGAIGIGLLATVASMLILMLIPYLEMTIKNDWYSDIGISFSTSACSVEVIVKAITSLGVKIKGIDIDEDLETGSCQATFHLRYKRKGTIDFSDVITGIIRELPGVKRITFQS